MRPKLIISISIAAMTMLSIPTAMASTTTSSENTVSNNTISQLEARGFTAAEIQRLPAPIVNQMLIDSAGATLAGVSTNKFKLDPITHQLVKESKNTSIQTNTTVIIGGSQLVVTCAVYNKGISGGLHYYEIQGYWEWSAPPQNDYTGDNYLIGYGGGFGYSANTIHSEYKSNWGGANGYSDTIVGYPSPVSEVYNGGVEWHYNYPSNPYPANKTTIENDLWGTSSFEIGIPTGKSGICDYGMQYSYNYGSYQPSLGVSAPAGIGISFTPTRGTQVVSSTPASFSY